MSKLLRTPLYDIHLANGAKMVPFAGYEMPVLYSKQSISASHNWVRQKSGLFDVSHMSQTFFTGKDAPKLLELITPIDLKSLKVNHSGLSVLLNENGGIIDDTMITKLEDLKYMVVTNAACAKKDDEFFDQVIEDKGFDVSLIKPENALVAFQGPLAKTVLQQFTKHDLSKQYFGQVSHIKIKDIDTICSRTGYTGEDGFEISVANDKVAELVEALLSDENVNLIGLGARDSLRLEAGLCLYGNDLDEKITPSEAGLNWVISKRRKEEGGFNGYEKLKSQLAGSKTIRRVGLISTSGPPARQGAEIFSKDGNLLGSVTSGVPSPTLKKNIAMGYVPYGSHQVGTAIDVVIRGKKFGAEIVKMPFVAANYYRG